MLCPACESLFAPGNVEISESKTLSYNPHFTHHRSGVALKSAALAGCLLCMRVWDKLSEVQRKSLCGDDPKHSSHGLVDASSPSQAQELPRATGQIHRFVKDGCYKFDFRCGTVKWHFITCPSVLADDREAGQSSWLETNTAAKAVLAQAKDWLRECTSLHDCGKQIQQDGIQQPWLPTRLVDVGTYSEPVLRLVSSKTIAPCSSLYVTLSHCWGLAQIFRLLESNLDDLHSSIPWDALTLTFQNAITVTRGLEIRYLWIDSLCIIQDSLADWLHEAAIMGDVYKYGYCNIAATGFPDGRRGFFSARSPDAIRPLRVRFCREAQVEKVSIQKLNRAQLAKQQQGKSQWMYAEWHEVVDVDMWTRLVDQAPLNHRGWVVQERVLSPRILHFTTTQLIWECRALEACETYPKGIPNIVPESRFTKYLSLYTTPTLPPNELDPSLTPLPPAPSFPTPLYHLGYFTPDKTLFHVWDVILRAYTASALTRPSDKLVAISGVARELAPRLRSRYLAGVWEVQLARQLLWIATPAPAMSSSAAELRDSTEVDAAYRAPSWSWASVDRPLKMVLLWDYRGARNQRDWLVDVLGAEVVPVDGHDAFGQVASAKLEMRGRMIGVTLTRTRSEKDAPNVAGNNQDENQEYKLVLDGSVLHDVTIFEDGAIDELEKQKFCVPLSVSISLPEASLDRRTLVYGLLLERLEGDGCVFRRLGVFMAPKGELFLIERGADPSENRRRAERFDWRDCSRWYGEKGKEFGDDVFTLV